MAHPRKFGSLSLEECAQLEHLDFLEDMLAAFRSHVFECCVCGSKEFEYLCLTGDVYQAKLFEVERLW